MLQSRECLFHAGLLVKMLVAIWPHPKMDLFRCLVPRGFSHFFKHVVVHVSGAPHTANKGGIVGVGGLPSLRSAQCRCVAELRALAQLGLIRSRVTLPC